MMWNVGGMHDSWFMGLGMVWVILGAVLVSVAIVWFSMKIFPMSDKVEKTQTPKDILLARLARGEIDIEKFNELLERIGD